MPGRAGRSLRLAGRSLRLAGLLLAAQAAALPAQSTIAPREELDFDRPEAWGMKYTATVVAFTPLAPQHDAPAGRFELALEIASVPSLSSAERRLGFNGTKVEDIDRAPAFARLRASLALPRGFVAELGVVPPVELDGLEPQFVALALSRSLAAGRRFALGARGQAQYGTLNGDITCSRSDVAAGDDPARNPLGCTAPSDDELELVLAGGELVLALVPARSGGLAPYLALGAQHLSGTFRVDARYAGLRDRTRLEADGWTWLVALGAHGDLAPAWSLAGELVYSPLDIRRPGRESETDAVATLRLAVSRRWR